MSNKDIVQKGMDARKNVKAAEARAAQAEQNAAEANDARLHDCVNNRSELLNLQKALEGTADKLAEAKEYIRKLLAEIEVMRHDEREQAKERERLLVELAKASAAIILTYTVRDLDLVAFWLANGLIIASELYLTLLLVKLLRKKK